MGCQFCIKRPKNVENFASWARVMKMRCCDVLPSLPIPPGPLLLDTERAGWLLLKSETLVIKELSRCFSAILTSRNPGQIGMINTTTENYLELSFLTPHCRRAFGYIGSTLAGTSYQKRRMGVHSQTAFGSQVNCTEVRAGQTLDSGRQSSGLTSIVRTHTSGAR
jgi:hypothetical protein